jgi:uncharacterized coiled-coil protein SlyX
MTQKDHETMIADLLELIASLRQVIEEQRTTIEAQHAQLVRLTTGGES